MFKIVTSTAFLLLFLFFGAAQGNTFFVPDDYSSIQAAIDASDDGDVILVWPGRYLENIGFNGKAITLRSTNEASQTVIDGNQLDTVVNMGGSARGKAVLDGFTITNGLSGPHVAGVNCLGNAELRNNIITGNISGGGAGGIYAYDESGSNTLVYNTLIFDNETGTYGGGMYVNIGNNSTVDIQFCTISHNTSGWEAGGAICFNASHVGSNTRLRIENSIIWGNTSTPPTYVGSQINMVNQHCDLSLSYSDLEHGRNFINNYNGGPISYGPGMIEVDPEWTSSDFGYYYLDQQSSPCIDRANPAFTVPREEQGPGMFTDTTTSPDNSLDVGPADMGYHHCQPIFEISSVFPDPPVAGQWATFSAEKGLPNEPTFLACSLDGVWWPSPPQTYVPQLNVWLWLKKPKQAGGLEMTDLDGHAEWTLPIPGAAAGLTVWFQAVQYENPTLWWFKITIQ